MERGLRRVRGSPTMSLRTRGGSLVPAKRTSRVMEDESAVSVEMAVPLFSPAGMSAPPGMTAAEHASWMERAPHKRLMLFSGRSNPALGEAIAARIGLQLGGVLLKTFTNGEVYVRYGESIRGADMFIVQSCSSPTNDSLMELMIMAQA